MINIICKEKKEMESINVSKRNVNRVSNLLFDRLVMGEKEKVLMILMSMFGRLCYEDLEEVYMDGCMVLWNRWKENKVHLQDEGVVKFLIKICKNIGMHYLRGVRDDVLSLDVLMEDRIEKESGEECCNIGDMFDVMDGGMNENDDNEMMERLKNVWEKLSDVDKIILVSYYWDGLKMEEIVKRVGYKSVDSVKSKKSKCLKRMLEMMKKEKAADQLPSLRSVPIRENISSYIFLSFENSLPRERLRIVQHIASQILIQSAYRFHVLIAQFKLHDFHILLEVVWLASWNRDEVTLHNPSQHNLRSRLAIFLSKRLQQWKTNHINVALTKRTPCLNLNAKLAIVGYVLFLSQERMNLNLIDDRTHLSIRKQVLQMMTVEIAHAKRANLPLLHKTLHHLPSVLHTVLHWPMNEQQVKIVSLELSKTLLNRLAHTLLSLSHHVWRHLSGEENLLASHPAVNDSQSHFCLIVITLSCINVTKSRLKSKLHIARCSITLQSPCSHTNLWNPHAIIQ